MITPNSSPPRRQTTSSGRDAAAQRRRERAEELVADAVAVDVVDALEVVDVEHQHGDRACVRLARERVQQALVEAAVVEQAGQGVGLGLVLEPRANLRVVEREGGGVARSASRARTPPR